MNKPKRNKKYNPQKNRSILIESSLRKSNVAIYYVGGHKACGFVDLDSLEILKTTNFLANTVTARKLNWSILNCVFLRESNGKYKIIAEEVGSPHECYQHQLSDSLFDTHKALVNDLVAKGLKKNILNVGWLAVPFKYSFDDMEMVDKLFTKLGVYDFVAPFELILQETPSNG